MQKYKQVNVVHPEDVGVPRKIMSDPPEEQHPSPAFKGSIWPIVIVIVMSCIVVGAFIMHDLFNEATHQTQNYLLRLPGVKISKDGVVQDEGEILIQGVFTGENSVLLNQVDILGFKLRTAGDLSASLLHHSSGYDIMSNLMFKEDSIDVVSLTAYISEDFDWCVVFFGGKHPDTFYVGSLDTAPDYLAILEKADLLS